VGYYLAPLPGLVVRLSVAPACRYAQIRSIGARSGISTFVPKIQTTMLTETIKAETIQGENVL
jgi:hypothetical protein